MKHAPPAWISVIPSISPLTMYVPEPPPLTIFTSKPSRSMSRRVSTIQPICSRASRSFSSIGQIVSKWPS